MTDHMEHAAAVARPWYQRRRTSGDVERARRHRVAVFDVTVRAEYALGGCIALYLGRDETCANVISETLVNRCPWEVKIDLVGTLLADLDLVDTFPWIVPILRKVFPVRHLLAHSMELQPTADAFSLLNVNRGRAREETLTFQRLEWLSDQAAVVVEELFMLHAWLTDWDGEPIDDKPSADR